MDGVIFLLFAISIDFRMNYINAKKLVGILCFDCKLSK